MKLGWNPHWSWSLFIYTAIILSIFSVIPAFYYPIQLYNKFEDNFLKKKWKFLIFGMNELYLVIYGTFLVYAINEPIVRTFIAGLNEDICPEFSRQFKVFVIEDACATWTPSLHKMALRVLQLRHVYVLKTDDSLKILKKKINK